EHAAAAELTHEPPALGYELERARKIEGAGRDERRVLAQAVAARQERLDAAFGQRFERRQAGDLVRQQGGLREPREAQLVARVLERQPRHVVADDVARLLVELLHGRELGGEVG